MTTRRRFVRNVLMTGAGVAGLSTLGLSASSLTELAAASSEDHHFVFCYFQGGWDTLVGIDPRDPRDFPDEDRGVHRIQPGYERLANGYRDVVRRGSGANEVVFGPYIGGMAAHHDKVALVRGLSMDTLTHEVGRRRFITGKPPSGLVARGSSIATHLASRLGGADAIPHLTVRHEAYNVDEPTFASPIAVTGSDDLVGLLQAADPALDADQAALLESFLGEEQLCERSRRSSVLRTSGEARGRMRTLLERRLSPLFDFKTRMAAMSTSLPDAARRNRLAALRTHFFDAADPSNAQLSLSNTNVAIAAQSLVSGISRVVSATVTGSLDTHFQNWETDQGPLQMQGWNAVAKLVSYLEGQQYDATSSWLDHTTIVCFSEFMRTPLINDRGGRDHWLSNSCLLVGGGIRPGVIGASSNVGMAPLPTNLTTGASTPLADGSDDNESVVKPEHVLQTLLVQAGVDVARDPFDLRVPPISRLLA